jgi:hypothetical protein
MARKGCAVPPVMPKAGGDVAAHSIKTREGVDLFGLRKAEITFWASENTCPTTGAETVRQSGP